MTGMDLPEIRTTAGPPAWATALESARQAVQPDHGPASDAPIGRLRPATDGDVHRGARLVLIDSETVQRCRVLGRGQEMGQPDGTVTVLVGRVATLVFSVADLYVEEPLGSDTLAAMEADLAADETPVISSRGFRQGDVYVQPDPIRGRDLRRFRRHAQALGDQQQVVVVPEGNRHVLRAALPDGRGAVRVARNADGRLQNVVWWLEVEAPAHALLVQPAGPNPHGPLGAGPGTYAVCRQVKHVAWSTPVAPATPARSPRPDTREAWQAAHNIFVVD